MMGRMGRMGGVWSLGWASLMFIVLDTGDRGRIWNNICLPGYQPRHIPPSTRSGIPHRLRLHTFVHRGICLRSRGCTDGHRRVSLHILEAA